MNPTATLIDKSAHIGWIDYAKGFAIYSVVLVHTHCNPIVTLTIRYFAIPLFFFLAGFLFSRDHNPDFGRFALKRFRQLIVPYIWINIVAYLLWVTVSRHYGSHPGDALQWHEPLWAATLGLPRGLVHDIPLWSLLCFYVVEMIYYLLPSRGRYNDLIIALAAALTASGISIHAGSVGLDLPLTLAPSAAALAFYALGHFVRTNASVFTPLFTPSPLALILGIAMLASAVRFAYPFEPAFFLGKLGNPLVYLSGAFGGIIVGLQIAAMLESVFRDGPLIRLISRGTLIICGFHLIIFSFIKGILYFGFDIDPDSVTSGILNGVVITTITIALCLPLIQIIERHFRFLVNK